MLAPLSKLVYIFVCIGVRIIRIIIIIIIIIIINRVLQYSGSKTKWVVVNE